LYCAKAVRLQLRLCDFNAFDYRETPSGLFGTLILYDFSVVLVNNRYQISVLGYTAKYGPNLFAAWQNRYLPFSNM
jgi:hypothetical protein